MQRILPDDVIFKSTATFLSLYFNIGLLLSNLDIIVQHPLRQGSNLSTSQYQNRRFIIV